MKNFRMLTGMALLWAALGACGCSTVGLLQGTTAKIAKADPKHPAVNVLAIWQPGEGPGTNGVPTRGFSAQVYFFAPNHSKPVQVDGTVRVYLFDDRGTPQERAKPIHQFDFGPETWNALLQKTTLGPAYGVFVPYPRKDFYQAACTLRIRFTPRSGPAIYSETSTIVLPGPTQPKPGDAVATTVGGSNPAVKPGTAAAATPEPDPALAAKQLRVKENVLRALTAESTPKADNTISMKPPHDTAPDRPRAPHVTFDLSSDTISPVSRDVLQVAGSSERFKLKPLQADFDTPADAPAADKTHDPALQPQVGPGNLNSGAR